MRGSGLLGRLAVVALSLLFLLAGSAHAQGDQAQARVEPDIATPGEAIDLIFTLRGPDLAEVSVQESIECTLTFPDGAEQVVCERQGSAVQVHLVGASTREHVFAYQAPEMLGAYTLDFEATSTLTVPPTTYTASATFTVVEPGDPSLDPGPSGDDGPGSDGDGAGGDPADDEAPGDPAGGDGQGDPAGTGADDEPLALNQFPPGSGNRDAARLFVSTTLGLGTVGVALVAQRWPIGGR